MLAVLMIITKLMTTMEDLLLVFFEEGLGEVWL